MTTAIEYALIAGHAYRTTRDKINWFPIPDGWTPFFPVPDPTTPDFQARDGFEAISFTNGEEIVISYAGTFDKDISGDVAADIALGAGLGSSQLLQAAEYYMKVKADNPNIKITFTGHSLGGGLASLMAIFFNETAVTFDQAPFRNSANLVVAAVLKADLLSKFPAASYPQIAAWLDPLDKFISSFDPMGAGWSPDGLAAREVKVTCQSVQGEFLSAATALRIGSELPPLTHGDYFAPLNLHSLALLSAFLQSDKTATVNKTFSQVTFKLTDLLQMIFDEKLFSHPTDSKQGNFLERLVRHEFGNASDVTTPDAMLTRFTSDLWKLAQDGGLTMNDGNPLLVGGDIHLNNVSKALTAFAMQMYYEDTANATNAVKQLFTTITGGVQFDMADVSDKFKTAFDRHEQLNLNNAKGYTKYFAHYLNDALHSPFTPEERLLINGLLPWLRDWYAQAGTSGMTASDTQNRGAFLLGGNGSDTLTGGTSADLLIGNAGSDILAGGKGNDILLGGAGNDTYQYTKDDGLDTVLDADGNGSIQIDGTEVHGGAQYGDERVHRDASKHLYVQVDDTTLIIDGNLIVNNYTTSATAGILGLNMTGATANPNPATTLTITGDIQPDDLDTSKAGIQALGSAQNNPIGTAQAYGDLLFGSTGNDRILSGALDDDVVGGNGDDWLEGGSGNDWLRGESWQNPNAGGNDLIEGGTGSDILVGESGDDRLYGNVKIDTATAIANGDAQTGSGLKGDWLAGNTGDDILVAGADNDVLTGGAGNDLLIGGAGDDNLMGDSDYVPQSTYEDTWRYSIGSTSYYHNVASTFNWGFTDSGNTRLFQPVEGEKDPAGSGADVIYAGRGDDYVWAGAGNDIVFGESGKDMLAGDLGNDILLGGADSDLLFGEQGDDYLDGGTGDDQLQGSAGDDILIGGKGDDTLYGDAGQDTYIYNLGDGIDRIEDTLADNNIIRFGAGVNKNNIKLHLGSLMLDLGNGDQVHIDNFDQNDVFNSATIKSFEFADGSTLTTTELLARGFDLEGTVGGEGIIGTNTADRIDGKGGTDYLEGGAGDDTYIFQLGDSAPAFGNVLEGINDSSGQDTVRIDGVTASSIKISAFPGDMLVLEYSTSDKLAILGGVAGAIERFDIGGEKLTYSQLIGRYSDTTMSGIDGNGYQVVAGGRIDDALVVTLGSCAEITLLQHFAADGSHRIENLQFADGSILASSLDSPIPSLTPATPGDDRYRFSRGDGVDLSSSVTLTFVILTWNFSNPRILKSKMCSDCRKTPGDTSGTHLKVQKATNDLVWRVAG